MDDKYDQMILDGITKADEAAVALCSYLKTLGLRGYIVRDIDPLEADAQGLEVGMPKVIGMVNSESPDQFRKAASACEQYLRELRAAH